jgi:imidazolonepropionase-like amidohydrolase
VPLLFRLVLPVAVAFAHAVADMPQIPSTPRVQAFIGGRLIDVVAGRVVDEAVMVVRDGRIESAGAAGTVSPPPGSAIVDLQGRFVMPGLISTHVHVSDVQGIGPRAYTQENTRRQLAVFARYGVTTVVSLGGEQAPAFMVRDAQGTPALDRARIQVAGDAVTADTPDQGREAVARVAASQPDWIKIRVDDNLGTTAKMVPAVYTAIIEEAHRRKLRVAAHVYYLDDAKGLLKAGVDMIAHSIRDREIDQEFISLMRKRSVPYCPTLTRELSTFVYESTPSFFSDPFFLREADPLVVARLQEPERQQAIRASHAAQTYKKALPTAQKNLARAAQAGVLIAMGTDAGPSPERFQGYFEHLELEMMAEAGLTPTQVLRAATIDAARALGRTDIGALSRGAWADFVVLDRNPLADVRHTRSIASVWISGNRVVSR